MIIATFDLGLALTGYAITDGNNAIDYGVISTPAHTPTGDRLSQICTDVTELLEQYSVDAIAYEKPFFIDKNTNAGIVMYAVGALLMAIADAAYPEPFPMTASQVKKHATGNGKADKLEVKAAVLEYYGITHSVGTKDDAYDALAGAIAYHALVQEVA